MKDYILITVVGMGRVHSIDKFNDMISMVEFVAVTQKQYTHDKLYATPFNWDGKKSIEFDKDQWLEFRKLTNDYRNFQEHKDPRFTT